MNRVFFLFCLLLLVFPSFGQEKKESSTPANIAAIVMLDSFVVTAKRQGFNVEEFIELVQADKSFYKAFQNLRRIAYTADNHISFYDKSGQEMANYTSRTQQHVKDNCRTMEVLQATSSGKFYKKNGKYKHYTSKMFDQVFFTHGEVCHTLSDIDSAKKPKGIQKHISELKKLIFQPGEKVDVPIIGGKTALFSEKMAPFYDYSISTSKFQDQIDCYTFTAKVKPQYQKQKEGKTIIKYLETYFERKTFQVLGRKYQLNYKGALFDFDVHMDIALKKIGNQYYPETINYRGSWDIPTKKQERGAFEARFFDFR